MEPFDAAFARLRLRDLQLLQAIAETRSLTVLGARMGVSQPALSRSLREIEAACGTVLFRRDKSAGLVLTPLGAAVLQRVQAVLADAQAMQAEVRNHREGGGGHLRLGVIPFVSNRLVQGLLEQLVDERHRMTVSTYEASTDQLLTGLLRQELDAVIGRLSAAGGEALHQEPLFVQDASVVAHPDHELARRRQAGLAALCRSRWILPPHASPTRLAFAEAFVRLGVPPPAARIETTSARVIHSMISGSPDTLGLVPDDIGRELAHLGGVRCLPMPVPFQMPAVGLIMLDSRRDWAANRALRDVLHAVLARGGRMSLPGAGTRARPTPAGAAPRRQAPGRR